MQKNISNTLLHAVELNNEHKLTKIANYWFN